MTEQAPSANTAANTASTATASIATASTTTVIGIALASVLVPLNSTMIAVALPSLAREFGIEKAHASVLVTVYLTAMLVGQPIAGRVGDRIGVRRLATISVVGFGMFSGLSMFAGTFPVLVACRAGQAVFASALMPSVQAMLRMVTTPADRGRAFGVQGSVIGIGAGLGPVIGGVLLATLGWRAIFGVNIPIVLVVLWVLRRTVPVSVDKSSTSPQSVPSASRERVANAVFVAAFSTQSLATFAQYGLLLLTPMLLDERGWGSAAVGGALSLLTVGLIVTSPPGGRLGDERGRRFPVLVGLAVAAIAVAASAALGDAAASAVLLMTLTLFGLGLGLASPGIQTAGIEAAPERRIGFASGLLSASRYVGSITASILLTLLVDDVGGGAGTMLALCTIALLLALGTASKLPGPGAVSAPKSAAPGG